MEAMEIMVAMAAVMGMVTAGTMVMMTMATAMTMIMMTIPIPARAAAIMEPAGILIVIMAARPEAVMAVNAVHAAIN